MLQRVRKMVEQLMYLNERICAVIGASYLHQRDAITVSARHLIWMSCDAGARWDEGQLTAILGYALHNRRMVLTPVFYTGEDGREWHRPGWYALGELA